MKVEYVVKRVLLGASMFVVALMMAGCAPSVSGHRIALDNDASKNMVGPNKSHFVLGYVRAEALDDPTVCRMTFAPKEAPDAVYAAVLCRGGTVLSYAYVRPNARKSEPSKRLDARLEDIATAELSKEPWLVSYP